MESAINDADVVILITDHPEYAKISEKSVKADAVVYDGRGILNPAGFKNSILATIGKPMTTTSHKNF